MGAVSSEGMPLNAAAAGSQDPDDRTGAVTARVAKLTRGQLDCLLLVDQHLSSKEIAAELNISENTVEQHLAKGMRLCSAALADSPMAERRSPWLERAKRRADARNLNAPALATANE